MARAIQMVRHGEPEELSIVDVADRPSQRGEVAIDVHAIGANFLDLMVVRGTYQILAPLPFSPGKEVAGIVSAVERAQLPRSGIQNAANIGVDRKFVIPG